MTLKSEAKIFRLKEKIKDLIGECESDRISIINPDDFSWSDLGYEQGDDMDYDTIEECLIDTGDFDEGQQVEIRVLDKIIVDLKELLK